MKIFYSIPYTMFIFYNFYLEQIKNFIFKKRGEGEHETWDRRETKKVKEKVFLTSIYYLHPPSLF